MITESLTHPIKPKTSLTLPPYSGNSIKSKLSTSASQHIKVSDQFKRIIAVSQNLFDSLLKFSIEVMTEFKLKIKYLALHVLCGSNQASHQMRLDLEAAVKERNLPMVRKVLSYVKAYCYELKNLNIQYILADAEDQKPAAYDEQSLQIFLVIAKAKCFSSFFRKDLFWSVFFDISLKESSKQAFLRAEVLKQLALQDPIILNTVLESVDQLKYTPIDQLVNGLTTSSLNGKKNLLIYLNKILEVFIGTKSALVCFGTSNPLEVLLLLHRDCRVDIEFIDNSSDISHDQLCEYHEKKGVIDSTLVILEKFTRLNFRGNFDLDYGKCILAFQELDYILLKSEKPHLFLHKLYEQLVDKSIILPILGSTEDEIGPDKKVIQLTLLRMMINFASAMPGTQAWDEVCGLLPSLSISQVVLSKLGNEYIQIMSNLPPSFRYKMIASFYEQDLEHIQAVHYKDLPLLYLIGIYMDKYRRIDLLKEFSKLSIGVQIPLLYLSISKGNDDYLKMLSSMPLINKLWAFSQVQEYLSDDQSNEVLQAIGKKYSTNLNPFLNLIRTSLLDSDVKPLQDKSEYKKLLDALEYIFRIKAQITEFKNLILDSSQDDEVFCGRYKNGSKWSSDFFDELTLLKLFELEFEYQKNTLEPVSLYVNWIQFFEEFIQIFSQLYDLDIIMLQKKLRQALPNSEGLNVSYDDIDVFGLLVEFQLVKPDDYEAILDVSVSKLYELGLFLGKDLKVIGIDHDLKSYIDKLKDGSIVYEDCKFIIEGLIQEKLQFLKALEADEDIVPIVRKIPEVQNARELLNKLKKLFESMSFNEETSMDEDFGKELSDLERAYRLYLLQYFVKQDLSDVDEQVLSCLSSKGLYDTAKANSWTGGNLYRLKECQLI